MLRRLRRPSAPQPPANTQYVDALPDDQTAVDLFAGEWASRLPIGANSGASDLFNDARIDWFVDQIGSIEGFSVLELGPLEGAHTTMLERHGAGSVLAVEANERAFLRCLVTKNLFDLRAKFMLGNVERLLARRDGKFDMILASGILYHLSDPLPVLLDMMYASDRICIWSHFFDAGRVSEASQSLQDALAIPSQERTLGSDRMTYYPMSYGPSAAMTVFRGGAHPSASWVAESDLVALFERYGYRVTTGHRAANTPNGPAVCILASRAQATPAHTSLRGGTLGRLLRRIRGVS